MSDLHVFWEGMCSQCHDPKNAKYARFGGRGICVCPEWRESFDTFAEWAHKNGYGDNGHGDGMRIVRKNLDRDFYPENCEVITGEELSRRMVDKKAQQIVQYKGQPVSIGELCEKNSLNVFTLHARIFKLGWSVEEAVDTPLRGKRHKKRKKSKKT